MSKSDNTGIDEDLLKCRRIMAYVKNHATKGDVNNVIEVIDKYANDFENAMHVGSDKGNTLDLMIQECNPTTAVELGAYFGYSAIRIAKLLKPGAMLYTIEVSPEYAKFATELIELAGMSERVTVLLGSSADVLPRFHKNEFPATSFDFVFIDHGKNVYKSDLLLMEQLNLLKKGSVVLADNVVYPGAPDYTEYVRNSSKYKCTTFPFKPMAKRDKYDEMEKAVFLGI